jgi:hypothetical protein
MSVQTDAAEDIRGKLSAKIIMGNRVVTISVMAEDGQNPPSCNLYLTRSSPTGMRDHKFLLSAGTRKVRLLARALVAACDEADAMGKVSPKAREPRATQDDLRRPGQPPQSFTTTMGTSQSATTPATDGA